MFCFVLRLKSLPATRARRVVEEEDGDEDKARKKMFKAKCTESIIRL